jgi:hypothetical protein
MTALALRRTSAKSSAIGRRHSRGNVRSSAGRAISRGGAFSSQRKVCSPFELSGTALQRIDLAATEHGERAPGGSVPGLEAHPGRGERIS